jgi:hypothetical protein
MHMELPATTTTPAPDQQTFKPDPGKDKFTVLYELSGKMVCGSATDAERRWFDDNAPAHWERSSSYGTKPADDKPADQQQQQQQQQQEQQPAQQQQATDLKAVAVSADEQADKLAIEFGKLFDDIDAHAASVFENERRRLRDAGATDPDGNAKALADAAKDAYRKQVLAKHQPRLLAEIAKLQEHERVAADRARLADCLGDKPSSLNLITLFQLGTPERERFENQVRGMNPASLRAVALQAEATGNRILAAAVKTANDALPKDQRVFSSSQLADKLFGQESLEIWQSAILTRNAVQGTIALLRQLETGRSDPIGKISRGLAARSAGKKPPMPNPAAPLGDDHPLSRISRGLKELAAASGSDGE